MVLISVANCAAMSTMVLIARYISAFALAQKKLFDNTEQPFRIKTLEPKGIFSPKAQNNSAVLDSVAFAGSAYRSDRSRLESYNAREASIMLL